MNHEKIEDYSIQFSLTDKILHYYQTDTVCVRVCVHILRVYIINKYVNRSGSIN